ncbi:hypothetical protein I6Y99_005107 [Vibrio parahaemolyticus]|nr:hypothetical protein [Vibrio parahaemolyticus]EGQ7811037.1 hypothetical protein [Vibrio parahaemolyticus]
MSKLDAIINILQIRENAPSEVTTHYHLTRKCYLSLDGDGRLYMWCGVNNEWIETKTALHEEALVLNFALLDKTGFCFAGFHACSRCHTPTNSHVLIGRDGQVVMSCFDCGRTIPVWPEIWKGIKKGVKSYSDVE